jgi:hypothetical protein
MSSSLTTLFMSFWLSSSTMSIFHCAGPLAVCEREGGYAYVAAGGLLDSGEDDCGRVSIAMPKRIGVVDVRSRWMSIMEAMLAGGVWQLTPARGRRSNYSWVASVCRTCPRRQCAVEAAAVGGLVFAVESASHLEVVLQGCGRGPLPAGGL